MGADCGLVCGLFGSGTAVGLLNWMTFLFVLFLMFSFCELHLHTKALVCVCIYCYSGFFYLFSVDGKVQGHCLQIATGSHEQVLY